MTVRRPVKDQRSTAMQRHEPWLSALIDEQQAECTQVMRRRQNCM